MLKLSTVIGSALPAALLALSILPAPAVAGGGHPEETRYSGRATVVNIGANAATLAGRVVLGDTGELDPSGMTREDTAVTLTNPAPVELSSKTITAITSGANYVSASSAAVEKLALKVGTLSIGADVVEANSSATCDPYTMTVATAGSSTITNLRINGKAYAVSGKPNQKISIPGVATIIINEQTQLDWNTIAVSALHVIVPGVPGVASADVVISYARSGILTCPCI